MTLHQFSALYRLGNACWLYQCGNPGIALAFHLASTGLFIYSMIQLGGSDDEGDK